MSVSGEQPVPAEHPSVLMLGQGWFPDQLGGLDRYFRCLLEHQPEARGSSSGRSTAPPSGCSPYPAMTHRCSGAWSRSGPPRVARRVTPRSSTPISRSTRSCPCSRPTRPEPTSGRPFPGSVGRRERRAGRPVAAAAGRLRRGLERLVYRRADRIVVLSSAFRRLLVERYRVSPWRVRVEPPGVDLERFSPGDRASARARFGLEDARVRRRCVRRLVPRMGLDVLLEAWAQALADLPPDAQLLHRR